MYETVRSISHRTVELLHILFHLGMTGDKRGRCFLTGTVLDPGHMFHLTLSLHSSLNWPLVSLHYHTVQNTLQDTPIHMDEN